MKKYQTILLICIAGGFQILMPSEQNPEQQSQTQSQVLTPIQKIALELKTLHAIKPEDLTDEQKTKKVQLMALFAKFATLNKK